MAKSSSGVRKAIKKGLASLGTPVKPSNFSGAIGSLVGGGRAAKKSVNITTTPRASGAVSNTPPAAVNINYPVSSPGTPKNVTKALPGTLKNVLKPTKAAYPPGN